MWHSLTEKLSGKLFIKCTSINLPQVERKPQNILYNISENLLNMLWNSHSIIIDKKRYSHWEFLTCNRCEFLPFKICLFRSVASHCKLWALWIVYARVLMNLQTILLAFIASIHWWYNWELQCKLLSLCCRYSFHS